MSAEPHLFEKIMASTERLTPFPPIAQEALDLASNKDVSLAQLVDVIRYDPVITSKILRLCNSSYFWIKEEVATLERAAVILGTHNIINILLTQCIKLPEFNAVHPGYDLGEGELWRHSVACAVLSGLLSAAAGRPTDTSLFTAALLHDIGKLVLEPFVRARYAEIQVRAQSGQSPIEIETELFGINHAELGGMIAAGWKFPKLLADAIRGHHTELENDGKPGVAAWVGLSNLVAYVGAFHRTCHHIPYLACQVKAPILERFQLSLSDMAEILRTHQTKMEALEALL